MICDYNSICVVDSSFVDIVCVKNCMVSTDEHATACGAHISFPFALGNFPQFQLYFVSSVHITFVIHVDIFLNANPLFFYHNFSQRTAELSENRYFC